MRGQVLALVAPLALALFVVLFAPAAALAHGDGLDGGGRIPGLGNFKRVGKTTYRFLPAKEEYEIRKPGRPPSFMHEDPLPSDEGGFVAFGPEEGDPIEEGEISEDPEHELAPICRTSGRRIVVVWTHRPEDETPAPVERLRNRVRWTNWKIAHYSSQSSEGQRVVKMVVDCDGEGKISVYSVATADNSFSTLNREVPQRLFGEPVSGNAVKYLIFDSESGNPVAQGFHDASKTVSNDNAIYTATALAGSGSVVSNTPLHELFHTLGAVQGSVSPPAPFSTESSHCVDGLDVMCYDTGTNFEGKSYSEKYCPASKGYGTTLTKPIDCGENTYFDAAPTPGTWLAKYWDLAGPEDPFLIAPPKAATEPVSSFGSSSATLRGTLNPEGYDVSYHFEYGPTEAYGSSTPSEVVDFGASPIEVSGIATGLKGGGATYHYRIVAESDAGTVVGEDETFSTPPSEPTPPAPKATTKAAASVKGTQATLNGSVNPEGSATEYHFEYGPTTSYGTSIPARADETIGSGAEGVAVSQTPTGLTDGIAYHYRVVAQRGADKTYGEDMIFSTPKLPKATTEAATAVKALHATLNATVNPWGSATTYRFEYDTAEYKAGEGPHGTRIPTSAASVGSGTEGVAVTQTPTGLTPSTTYHYRVVAESGAGVTYGEEMAFRTTGLPRATTRAATSVKATQATLNATVNPEGTATEYHFEYGETTSYGTSIPIPDETIGSGTEKVVVSEPVIGLSTDTTYHYRIVAKNEAGGTLGNDRTFSTGSDLTVLCQVEEEGSLCSEGNALPEGTPFEAVANQAVKIQVQETKSNGTITCENSHLLGQLQSAAGHPLNVGIDEWSLEACTGVSGGSCTPAQVNLPYAGSLTWTEGTDGTLALEADGKGKSGWGFGKCLSGLAAVCTYGPGAGLAFEGGSPAQLAVPEMTLEILAGTSCGKVTLQAVAYTLIAPEAAYAAHRTAPRPPLPVTGAATGVGTEEATLNGTVNPEGSATSYRFEYDTAKFKGGEGPHGTSIPTSAASVGSGTEGVAVSQAPTGLKAGTTYHYRLVAESAEGTAYGADKTLHTLDAPHATTEAATEVKAAQAILHGTVDPEGSATEYHFEWSTQAEFEAGGYAHRSAAEAAGSGTEGVAVGETATGLQSGTTYHYRVVAENTIGTTYGADETFTTATDPCFDFAFGKKGTGNGEFESPNGIATDSSGNIWVTDTANNRIEKFNAKGEYLSQFGKAGAGNGEFNAPKGIAIDSSGNIWVVDSANNRVQEFSSEGKYLAQLGKEGTGEGQFKSPTGIAFSTSPTLFFVVDTGNNRVQKFNTSLKFQAQFGKAGTGNGEFKSPSGVAVDAAGRIWVTDTGNNRVQKFNATTYAYISQLGKEGTGNGEFKSPSGIAFDINNRLWVTDTGNGRAQRFDTEGNYLDQFGTQGTGAGQLQSPLGVLSPTPWDLLVVDSANNRVQKWTLVPDAPTVETEAASEVKSTSATLNATVNPNSLATEYHFEYGTSTKYGTSVPIPDEAIKPGQGGVKVSKAISGLASGTKYNFRVVASNSSGTTYGLNKTFTTLKDPKATTEAATNVKANSATLNGTVNPEGSETSYRFEYDTAAYEGKEAHGTAIPVSAESVGSGTANVAVAQTPTGLKASTTYHFRLVAESAVSTAYGADKTFETKAVSTATQLAGMAVTEPFDGSSESLERFGSAWSALGWAEKSIIPNPKGSDTTTGWMPQSYPTVTGAFYGSSVSDSGWGLGAVATMAVNPGNENRYFSLWLDMPTPAGTRAGYELRFTYVSLNTYNVTLSKWVEGAKTELASKSSYAFSNGNSFALVDLGGTVSAWTDTGAGFGQLLSAEDSSFEGGKAGLEGSGNATRLTNFKVGSLKFPKATTEAATNVKANSVTLNGTVNPEGSETSYRFEYDTAAYKESQIQHGTSIPVPAEGAGSGTESVAVSQAPTGLKLGTTYHYRLVAENAEGIARGADKAFTTDSHQFDFAFGKKGTGNGEFESPNGIATDSSGNIWVTDTANNRIEKFNAKGEYLSQFGKAGAGNGEFNAPKGIAIDSSGNIWVVDSANNRVQEFSSEGKYLAQLGKEGTGEGQFKSPTGIAFSTSPTLFFVVDTGNNRVQKFNTSLKFQAQFGKAGTGNGEFKSPSGVAVDAAGRIWVTDTGNNRVQKFNATTYAYISQLGKEGTGNGEFKSPSGIAFDINNRLWVTDTGNGRAQRFDTEGNYLDQFGTQGTGAGQLQSPLGVLSPTPWDLLVVDSANNRVQKWTLVPDAPTVETEAASEVKSTSATLNATVNPNSLATEYHFEYGTSTKYGTSVPIPDEAIKPGQGGVKVSKAISGLASGTKYNFRVVASNSSGTTYGLNKSFTTP
jgi:sugar lactone lactonase YvrE